MTTHPYRALGNRLLQLMERERMNQPELAAAADVSPSYPSKILGGQQRPSFDILVRLARALNADIDELSHLAGFTVTPVKDRPELPGWESLDEEAQTYVRSLISMLAERSTANDASPDRIAGSTTGPRRRDRTQVELETIAGDLSPAGRAALLDTARALQSMDHVLAEPSRQAPSRQSERAGQEPA